MHRPNPDAHTHCTASQPKSIRGCLGFCHIAGKVKGGIGGEYRNYDREADPKGIISGRNSLEQIFFHKTVHPTKEGTTNKKGRLTPIKNKYIPSIWPVKKGFSGLKTCCAYWNGAKKSGLKWRYGLTNASKKRMNKKRLKPVHTVHFDIAA